MGRRINEAGKTLIQGFEKRKLEPYPDEGGLWTVGWGHLLRPGEPHETWTQAKADAQFIEDIGYFEERVERLITVELNDNQFAALVSFDYNTHGLFASTLRKKLNSGDYDVESEFMRWVKVRGVVSNGLIRRRKAEVELWKTPISSSATTP